MHRHVKRLTFLATPVLLIALGGAAPDGDDTYAPISSIQIPGQPLKSFDISEVDPLTNRYFLSDRSNKSVDVVDTRSNSVIGQVGGFVGAVLTPGTTTVNNDVSGPNGNVPVGFNEVWAGDGNSTVKVVDLRSMSVTDTISTGGQDRADEMTYDPDDHLIAVANDADTPPFLTFISTKPGHAVLGKIVFSDATSGLEQPQYDRETHLIYESVPQVGSNPANGVIRVMDPKTISVVRDIALTNCQPAGLTQGPQQQFLAGCGITPTSGGAPANTQVFNALTGGLVADITGVGGSDEVWYNPGNQLYFLGASNNPTGPVLGIIRAWDNKLVQTITTGPSSHSVAADWTSNHAFVPLTAAANDPACPNGCIKVYAPKEQPFRDLVQDLIADLEHFH